MASFYCGARGDPRPTIQWRKNNKKVSDSLSRYEILDRMVGDSETGSVLRIEPTRAHRDNAVYECFAENGVGDAVSANAKLEVYDGKCILLFKNYFVVFPLSLHEIMDDRAYVLYMFKIILSKSIFKQIRLRIWFFFFFNFLSLFNNVQEIVDYNVINRPDKLRLK